MWRGIIIQIDGIMYNIANVRGKKHFHVRYINLS
jgi:hypothetical protein